VPKRRAAIAIAVTPLVAGGGWRPAVACGPSQTVPAIPELERLPNSDQHLSMTFENAPVATVLREIAKTGSIQLCMEDTGKSWLINVSLADGTVTEALELVASETNARYELSDSGALRVSVPRLRYADRASLRPPQRLKWVPPYYQEVAREAKANGNVELLAFLLENGKVRVLDLVSSDANWPEFGTAAMVALRQREYTPALKDGRPVNVYFAVRTQFEVRP